MLKIDKPETRAPINETRVCPSDLCPAPEVGSWAVTLVVDEAAVVRDALADVIEDTREVIVPLRELDIVTVAGYWTLVIFF